MHALDHEEVAKLAYKFWEERGCPFGSSEIDWSRAEQALLARQTAGPGGNPQPIEASRRSPAA